MFSAFQVEGKKLLPLFVEKHKLQRISLKCGEMDFKHVHSPSLMSVLKGFLGETAKSWFLLYTIKQLVTTNIHLFWITGEVVFCALIGFSYEN